MTFCLLYYKYLGEERACPERESLRASPSMSVAKRIN
jgi:hypothetical protein